MKTTIPFAGFYESVHDGELDWALENMFSTDSGDILEGLLERANNVVDWENVRRKYANEYAEAVAEACEIPSLKFECLVSPREYNFTTDRIFCTISEEDVRRLLEQVDKDVLTKTAQDCFTSRSGFHSFYDPDWTTWGPVETWDHNQVGILLLILTEEQDELDLMESARCNGRYDNWFLDENPELAKLLEQRDRLVKLADLEGDES